MGKLYDRADIYDLVEDDARIQATRDDWMKFLDGKEIKTFLDVSIGTGGMTLPLQELGIEVSGSDLNPAMLKRCRDKAEARGKSIELKECDFRDLSVWQGKQYDCVGSTGNSLGYVCNEDVLKTLEQMDALVKPGGYIYIDSRNWERIQREKQRFYLYNPFFHDGDRVNLIQVWDHNSDGTITFNLVYTFERDNKLFQKELFVEDYKPFSLALIKEKLKEMGYGSIEVKAYPYEKTERDFEEIDWYRLIARKG